MTWSSVRWCKMALEDHVDEDELGVPIETDVSGFIGDNWELSNDLYCVSIKCINISSLK